MMINSTQVLYFTLSSYLEIGPLKYLCFMIIMCLYILIVVSNVLLIVVICVNRSLHEPMYIFLCSLFVNELYGSSGLFPFLLVQILSDVHTVAAPLCFLQIFCVYNYAIVEFLNLAVMSYDRYVAICFPLQYNAVMSLRRVALLVALTWGFPFLVTVVLISLSAPLLLCGNIIDKVFCGNYSIVKLSCSNTSINNIYGLVFTVLCIVLPLIVIFYTYTKILEVCFSGTKQTRQKAISTCTPHLASILNFSFGCCSQILQGRFDTDEVPSVLAIVLSLYFLACQPLFNPVLYGLKITTIREASKHLLCAENSGPSTVVHA